VCRAVSVRCLTEAMTPERPSRSPRPWALTVAWKRTRYKPWAAFVLLSGLLLLVAFLRSWEAVAGLRWPFDSDHLRNIADAVTFKDGDVLSDAHYSGVPAWYSPLTSGLLALVSLVTTVPIHRLVAQGGPVLNLVTPIALCWVSARWFGRRVAILTLLVYLFVMGSNYPAWAIASYSPWMYVPYYAAGIYIVALATVPAAINRAATRDALLLGVTSGAVVLVHPALSLLLMGVVAVQFLFACWHATRQVLARLARSAGISFATALIMSAPFLLPILTRYQGRVRNDSAGRWIWSELERDHVWGFLAEFLTNWPMLVIGTGLLIWIARQRPRRQQSESRRATPPLVGSLQPAARTRVTGTSILIAWTFVSFFGLVLEAYRGSALGELVPIPAAPSHHYLLSLSITLCIWFGISLNAIVQALLGPRNRRWGTATVAVVAVAIVLWTLPSWRNRTDFVDGRSRSKSIEAQYDGFSVVAWIRANTEPHDEFLGQPGLEAFLPGLAGRKSVFINYPEFSNPFVSFDERQRLAEKMIEALRACDLSGFERLARHYGRVRYVLTPASANLQSACPGIVPTVYSDKAVNVQRIVLNGTS
jgi:hypothetical protein